MTPEPGPAHRFTRRGLLLSAVADILLCALAVAVSAFPLLLWKARTVPAATERIDRWRFGSVASDSDAAVRRWAATQAHLRLISVERDSSRPAVVIRYTAPRNSGPATPPWDSFGYAMPYLERSTVLPDTPPGGGRRFAWALTVLVSAIPLLWIAAVRRRDARAAGLDMPPLLVRPGPEIFWPMFAAYAGFIGIAAAAQIAGKLLHWNTTGNLADLVAAARSLGGWGRAFFFLGVAAGTPVAEECLFRGLIYGRFRAAGYPVSGAILSAVLFGVCHTAPIVATIALCGFGLMLAWLYQRTNSLWPPVVLHGFHNAWVLLVALR